jgi:hypothetical protein
MIIVYFLWVIGQNFGQKSQIVRGLREGARGGGGQEVHKKCEGCRLKQPSFGLPSEGMTRWCAGCAKGHVGAETLRKIMFNIKTWVL